MKQTGFPRVSPNSTNTGYRNAPGYPGSLHTCATPIQSNTTYSFCDFSGGVDVGSPTNHLSNVTFIGCRFHGSGDVMVRLYGDNFTFNYDSFEPGVATPPVSHTQGYQYGIEANGGWATTVQQLTMTHNDIWGFANAIDTNGSTQAKPQVFRDNWIHDARDDGGGVDHVDGIGSLNSGGMSYVVVDHNTIVSFGNTQGLAFQAGPYDHFTVTNNYFSGFWLYSQYRQCSLRLQQCHGYRQYFWNRHRTWMGAALLLEQQQQRMEMQLYPLRAGHYVDRRQWMEAGRE